MNDQNSGFEKMVAGSRIIVAIGSGGVGKTTSSIAIALMAARAGKRVGLLSIDPAKRLADALGIPLGSELVQVQMKEPLSGSVEAAMLDQKAVFDEMVRRFAPSSNAAQRIFNNSIYKEVSSNLGGPLEYMALAKLESMLKQGRYDLIVLDTPPDTHALDFLARPNILSGFIEHGVMSWLIKPFHLAQKLGAGSLFRAGGKIMNGISSITGIKMLRLLAEFLVLMEDVIIGFNRIGREVTQSLRQNSTGFVLVSAPYQNAVRSAFHLMRELKIQNYPLLAIVMNRNMPFAVEEAVRKWPQYAAVQPDLSPGLGLLKQRFESAQSLADQLAKEARQLFQKDIPLLLIEEQAQMILSEDTLWNFVDAMTHARVKT